MSKIDQCFLKEMFDYNPETGVFIKRIRPIHHFNNEDVMKKVNARDAGKVAGSKHHSGYLVVNISRKIYQLHRIAWVYIYGSIDERQIDHINGVRNDNRIENLRLVSPLQNTKNAKIRNDNKTGFVGVSLNKKTGKYQADICVNNKHIYLGVFNTAEDANQARVEASKKYGFHKNHGREL